LTFAAVITIVNCKGIAADKVTSPNHRSIAQSMLALLLKNDRIN
jgi:hypothetical protein